MSKLASRPEHEVRHALEVLASANPYVVLNQLDCVPRRSGGLLDTLRDALVFRGAVNAHEDVLATLPTLVDPAVARAAQATEVMWRQVESEFDLLSSAEVGEILGASNRAYASSLRKRGELLGMQRKNAYVFPGFQFDRAAGKIRSWVKPLLKLAAEHERSATDAIAWIMSPTTYLGGDRPADHVADSDAERLLSVAERAWGVDW